MRFVYTSMYLYYVVYIYLCLPIYLLPGFFPRPQVRNSGRIFAPSEQPCGVLKRLS